MGSLLQAATYGQTIPLGYGLTQSPLLAIWALGGNADAISRGISGHPVKSQT